VLTQVLDLATSDTEIQARYRNIGYRKIGSGYRKIGSRIGYRKIGSRNYRIQNYLSKSGTSAAFRKIGIHVIR
jgi:hypothetical protein